jgi:hypothetical protein
MKHILAVIGLLGCTYPAQAQNVIPPLEYDHPYNGKVIVERSTSQAEIRSRCDPSTFPYHLGCSRLRPDGCYILLADDEFIRKHGWTSDIVLRHEIGHCNGWPGDHRGGGSPRFGSGDLFQLRPRLPGIPTLLKLRLGIIQCRSEPIGVDAGRSRQHDAV